MLRPLLQGGGGGAADDAMTPLRPVGQTPDAELYYLSLSLSFLNRLNKYCHSVIARIRWEQGNLPSWRH